MVANKPFMLSVIALNDIMLNIIYVKCCFAEYHNAECCGSHISGKLVFVIGKMKTAA